MSREDLYRMALEKIIEKATKPPRNSWSWARVQWAADIAQQALDDAADIDAYTGTADDFHPLMKFDTEELRAAIKNVIEDNREWLREMADR